MAQYDSKIIYEFADRLLNRAQRILAGWTISGVLVGIVLVALFNDGARLAGLDRRGDGWIIILLFTVPIVIGYQVGREKGFKLRLEAQQALCLVRIEENTRKPV